MWPRHLIGVAFAFVATPVGLMVFDYGATRYLQTRALYGSEGRGGFTELTLMVAGALVLMAVVASARVSGLGPILAGFLWALVPLIWFMIDLGSFYSFSQDLPSTHFWFSNPPFLFGLVAPLFVGAGLAGRWRGQVKPGP